MSVLCIAEAGVNHGGDEAEAYKLIDAAIDAKADAVKFQLYRPDLLAEAGEKREMLEKLLLPREAYIRLNAYCSGRGIRFSCTAFDEDSLKFLLENTEMPFIKIASPSVSHGRLLDVAAKAKKPILISTGMSHFPQLWETEKKLRGCDITWLFCVSKYPCPLEDISMRKFLHLKALQRPLGISDHSANIAVPITAVALGAKVVECHLTLDRTQPGPDHKASLTPQEFKQMVSVIRDMEKIL